MSDEYSERFMAISQQTKAVIKGKTTYYILAPDYLPLKNEGILVVLTHDTSARPVQSMEGHTDALCFFRGTKSLNPRFIPEPADRQIG